MRQLKINKTITNREDASLDKYLQEIGKEELISVEEEVRLARLVKRGDKEALQKLIKANLRFVVSVAKQYQNQGLTLPDLINEGNLGLITAVEKFDETRGFKFISYAVWWIRQRILQAIVEQSRTIRLPINQAARLNRVTRHIARFVQENERLPTILEIAEDLEMMEMDVRLVLNTSQKPSSLDASFTEDENDFSLLDVIGDPDSLPPDKNLNHESLERDVRRSLNTLSSREADILSMYFGLSEHGEMTLDEIGEYFGLTRERVRQIKEKAIRRLRHSSRARLLKGHI